MKNLITNKTTRNAAHHDFTYKDGHKTPIEKDGLTRCYLDNPNKNGYRMLKATEREDIAGSVSGKYVETDEVKCENGTPVINGKKYNIWGIGENYVIVSAVGDKHYIAPNADGSHVDYPHQDERTEAYKKLHEIYKMLV